MTACSAPPSSTATTCGELCLRLGNAKAALHWLDAALAADPSYPAAHRTLAKYYTDTGEPKKAAKHQKLADQASPK